MQYWTYSAQHLTTPTAELVPSGRPVKEYINDTGRPVFMFPLEQKQALIVV